MTHGRTPKALLILTLVLGASSLGCGGGAPAESTTPVGAGGSFIPEDPNASASGASRGTSPAEEDDGMLVEGTLGTLPESDVRSAINSNSDAIFRCFSRRYADVDVLSGDFEMSFRVKADGSVRWVFLGDSNIGDRETERCVLGALSRVRFARPRGGEAEVTTSLSLGTPEDVRPPVAWPASRVARVVEREASAITSRCGIDREGLEITAYIAPGGRVLAAGASVARVYEGVDGGAPGLDAKLDCVASAVASLTMPDPGSYPAKVEFRL